MARTGCTPGDYEDKAESVFVRASFDFFSYLHFASLSNGSCIRAMVPGCQGSIVSCWNSLDAFLHNISDSSVHPPECIHPGALYIVSGLRISVFWEQARMCCSILAMDLCTLVPATLCFQRPDELTFIFTLCKIISLTFFFHKSPSMISYSQTGRIQYISSESRLRSVFVASFRSVKAFFASIQTESYMRFCYSFWCTKISAAPSTCFVVSPVLCLVFSRFQISLCIISKVGDERALSNIQMHCQDLLEIIGGKFSLFGRMGYGFFICLDGKADFDLRFEYFYYFLQSLILFSFQTFNKHTWKLKQL